MAVVEIISTINAPVRQVFQFVNDAKRHHEFVAGMVGVDVTPGKAGRVGEVWTTTYSNMGMRSRVKATITEWEENKRAVWRYEGAMEGVETQLYEPAGANATKLTYRNEFRMKGIMGLLGPLMAPMIKGSFRKGSETMKRICEAEAKK